MLPFRWRNRIPGSNEKELSFLCSSIAHVPMTFLISLALFDKGEGVMSCDTLQYNAYTNTTKKNVQHRNYACFSRSKWTWYDMSPIIIF